MMSANSNENEKRTLQRLADYMQQGETLGAEIGIYAIAGVAFAAAYWKIRPITKFGKPTDIPKHFIQNRLKQTGDVTAIEPTWNGPLLQISHRPPLNFQFASKKRLPVKLFGVQINQNGYSWLQSIVVSNTVKFVPLSNRSAEFVECQVYLDNHPSSQLPVLDLAACLTSLGFAHVIEIPRELSGEPAIAKYHQHLKYVQDRAKRNRNGVWSDRPLSPSTWMVNGIKSQTMKAIYTLFSLRRPLPELLR